ncbi:uncharacterized protein LOC135156950 [Lytechinus pictus]|uniref:uncharacterized protein LOC135156950 n=1 Tax=Lytechinus pictus TaxID=7653 RepID=UPI0030BA1EA2
MFQAAFLLAFFGFLRVGEFTVQSQSDDGRKILAIDDIQWGQEENSQFMLKDVSALCTCVEHVTSGNSHFFIAEGTGNWIWIVGDSLVRRAKERASQRNYQQFGERGIVVRWHGQGGTTLQDLPRMVSNRLRCGTSPALAIVHLGSNDIGQYDVCRCRMAIDTAIQDLRTRMPHTHITWSGMLPRLFYYGRKQGSNSQEALDGVRKSLNKYARRKLARMSDTTIIKHEFDPTIHSLFNRDRVHLSDSGSDILIDSFRTAAREAGFV